MNKFLINSDVDFKQHVVLAATFDFKKVAPYRKRSDRKYIISMIGLEQYQALVDYIGEDAIILEVKDLFSEASANFLLYTALPTINTLITNSGTKTTETTQSKDSDWRDVRDLKRSLINTANEAIDLAMEVMEANSNLFTSWKSSDYFTVFNNMVIRHTQTFNTFYNIQNSRKTFIALKPYMLEVEVQYLLPALGKCTLDFLKKTSDAPVVKIAQEYLQQTVVAFTVSKAALTGTFSITDTAFVLATEELSWEKKKLELDENKLQRLRQDRESSAGNYLKNLTKIIIDNPDVFTCFEQKSNTTINHRIEKLKGSIAL